MSHEGIAKACYSCVLDQVNTAAKYAQISEKETAELLSQAQLALQSSAQKGIIVQHIIRSVADKIADLKKEGAQFDIYKEVKQHSNQLAQTYVTHLQAQIDAGDTPLDTAIQISAAGNIIDFGAKNHGALDLDAELKKLQTITFNHYDIAAFRAHLATAKSMLYICDNAGEIVFDKLFIQCLQKIYPQLEIIAAVRDKPIINDATLADASAVGLNDVVRVISSGSVYPGTILPETSAQFKLLYNDADLIVAKGQGNFETLLPIAADKLFFILRIKCEQMASLSGVEKGCLVLMQGKQK